jgi:hypothetical protein
MQFYITMFSHQNLASIIFTLFFICEYFEDVKALFMSGLTGPVSSYFTQSAQLKPILDCLPMKPVMHCIVFVCSFCFLPFHSIQFFFISFYSSSDDIKSNYVTQQKWFYWWRAVSSSFYLRPNAATLEALDKYSTLPLHSNNDKQALSFPNDNNGQCISIYMRRGDKSQEMKLVPFSRYIEAVEIVMERFLNTSEPRAPGTKGKPAIFIGTESNEALLETIAWGEKNDYQVSYVLINGNTQHDIKTIPDV